jgi:hypothetical protein
MIISISRSTSVKKKLTDDDICKNIILIRGYINLQQQPNAKQTQSYYKSGLDLNCIEFVSKKSKINFKVTADKQSTQLEIYLANLTANARHDLKNAKSQNEQILIIQKDFISQLSPEKLNEIPF